MGLDIYLYPQAASEANKKHYEIWSDDAPELTTEQIRAWEEAHPRVPHEDVDSTTYPDHYYKRTYLRSSYNSGGFNSAVPQMLGAERDLYWIFEPIGRNWRDGEDDEPLTTADIPGLRESKARALSVAEDLRAIEAYAAITASHNVFAPMSRLTDDEAVARFREELKRESSFGWYSSAGGEFFRKDPPTILAAIPGVDGLGSPAVHLIYRRTDVDWYWQAAEITAEFCDEAIALIERDGSCEMSWSG